MQDYILTSVCIIAALTDSPNQRPSEFTDGKELLKKEQMLQKVLYSRDNMMKK